MKAISSVRSVARTMVQMLPNAIGEALRRAKRWIINARGAQAVFRDIYTGNNWDGTESVSGPGSSKTATSSIREGLPGLLAALDVKTFLDIPCGDAFWIGDCLPGGITYIGGDVVPELIAKNIETNTTLVDFRVLNLISDPLPRADLVFVRDCLIHLPNAMVLKALANIKQSGALYLLTTTYSRADNIDIELGGFRPIDLTTAPFSLPQPLQRIAESEGGGKAMGLWRIKDY